MKVKIISILLVVTLVALACLYLDDFSVSNSFAGRSWRQEDYNGRDYPEAVTVTITVDGLAIRLFERKIRECIPRGFDEKGVLLGIPTGELFDCVYESLSEKAKEIYDRDEADAMTDIALDNLGEDGVIEYDYDEQWQWKYIHRSEYRMKHKTE